MKVFNCIFLSSFVRLKRMFQAMLIFFLFPMYMTIDYVASPIIENATYLWSWNIPSESCPNSFNVTLDLRFFHFVGYPYKKATGQNVTLFYVDRLGSYPYINKNLDINGGFPQLGNLQAHLENATRDIIYYLPNDSVSLAVIDWEEWRPLWIRNWGAKKIYQNKSIELVMHNNQTLNLSLATKKAKLDFEKAAKDFMLETLKLGKSLRPSSYWGFYLFPDCYNHQYANESYNGSCFDIEKTRNNQLNWLWNESTALYPSIYLNTQLKSCPKAALFARNRVQEAIRVSKVHNAQNPLPVFVYVRPVFTDASGEFLSEVELVNTVGESVALGASGIIVWGSLNLSKSKEACEELKDYVKTVLNPYLLNVSLAAKMCSQVLCQGQGICIRKNYDSADYLHLNPDTFKIDFGEDKEYQIHGQPTDEDLKTFTEKFDCSCYSNMNCTTNISVTSTVDINVCFANVCISSNYSQ